MSNNDVKAVVSTPSSTNIHRDVESTNSRKSNDSAKTEESLNVKNKDDNLSAQYQSDTATISTTTNSSIDGEMFNTEDTDKLNYFNKILEGEEKLSRENYLYGLNFLVKLYQVKEEVDQLRRKIALFNGTCKDVEYTAFDERLIEITIKLDSFDTRGISVLRKERKKLIVYIQSSMRMLDSRARVDEHPQENETVMH